MPTTLRCPACSAPLEIPAQHAATSRCPYCGVAVLLSERPQGTQAATNDPHAETIAEVVRILQAGHMIQAVKLYRERFGVGLKEAKDAVDQISAGQPAGTVPHLSGGKGSNAGCGLFLLLVVLGIVMLLRSSPPVDETSASPAAQASGNPAGAVAPLPAAPKSALADEVLRFGSEGTGAGRFTDARGVAVDGAGRIYVAEYQGGRVQVFDSAGAFVTQWMADPKMPLLDLEADRGGTVYLVQYGRIRRYEGATGNLLGELPRDRGTSYSDVALALDGTMWAVAGTSHIAHLGRDGAVRRTIDLRQAVGDDASPERVAVAGTGDVYVLDRRSGEVYHLNPQGRFVDRFGGRGEGPESTSAPDDIAIDGRGRVLVSDLGRGIRVFDASGRYVGAFGGEEVVFGLAVTDRDEVFAAYRNRHEVVKFRLEP